MNEQTDRQRLLSEWTAECESAIAKCPLDFLAQLTRLSLAGQRIIIESSVCAEIDGAKTIAETALKGKGA